MATLIAAYNSSGCIGRCDAKCYHATGPVCDCICGGSNHGAGHQRAQANTVEMAERWIEAYAGDRPDASDFQVPARDQAELGRRQPSLFELLEAKNGAQSI